MKFHAAVLYSVLAASSLRAAEWQSTNGFRFSQLSVPTNGTPGFTAMTEATTGIHFTNHLSNARVAENQILLNGSGVALGDVDGDGRPDIYLCQLEGPNALYRNLGDWKFEDITASAGVACSNQATTGAVFADVDGDGDLDLLVNSAGGGTRCFFNDGRGRFTENNSGLLKKFCATSMALADVDGNGTLDLYVANYRTTTIRSTGLQVLNVGGRRMLKPEDREGYEITPEGMILEHAEPDQLYLNDGKGNFTPVPWNGGAFLDADGKPLARGDKDWGLSVQLRDLNGDGAPDIYVCNDFWSADAIWINDGKGKFRALSPFALRTTSTFSMGIDFADINRDGLDDFIVLDMRSREHARRMRQRSMISGTASLPRVDERPQIERNTLFLNRGDGTFAEIAQLAGVQASEWSWCAALLDVDLDGYEDLLITTGHLFDSQDSDAEMRVSRAPKKKLGENILEYPPLAVPNQAFRNRGDLTFEPAGDRWRFNQVGVSQGMALADLDGDGDLDAVVNNLNGSVSMYRNDAVAPRVAVKLKGRAPNTQGIGAKIVVSGGAMTQSQQIVCGGRYLSGDEAMRVFAAWNATNRFTVAVTWRSGGVTAASNVFANTVVELDEANAKAATPLHADSVVRAPLFRDASAALEHVHVDEPFDDFARQPTLTKRLSQFGPGVTWADMDGDGRDDLLIDGGRGGKLAFRRNEGGGKFQRMQVPAALTNLLADQTTLLAVPDGGGNVSLLAGQANYETADGALSAATRWNVWAGGFDPKESLPPQASSAGALAMADVDGDGTLDLFVAGQCNGGKYPEPAASRLFRGDNGRFTLVQEFDALVNGAVFSDLTGDGFPELVLTCDWDSPKILRNERGKFAPWNPPVKSSTAQLTTLNDFTGWWTGVAAGDFDGDGRIDFVAGNWGRNHPWHVFAPPLRMYFGDFSASGRVDGIMSYIENGRELPWHDLDVISRIIPSVRAKFTSYAQYGDAALGDVLGTEISSAKKFEARWLDSTVFLNRGDRFEARPLPLEAQLSPAFGIVVADFDGDGHEDIFLAQNFSPTDAETSRYDAGRGVLLRGKGNGDFSVMAASESGIAIPGDGRGAAACDYDGDGRVDLAVGQNNGPTKLFHNERAKQGLRVKLRGASANSTGIGAVIRRGGGAAHEVHAGSGWWSQDSATQVIAGLGTNISVRWPGGVVLSAAIPANATSITVDANGKVTSP